jgi:pimeloyl-ACP methyl ester carboxylesterase
MTLLAGFSSCGHFLAEEGPEETAAELLAFLDSV